LLIGIQSCETSVNENGINELEDPILLNQVDAPPLEDALTIEHDPDSLSVSIDSIWYCQKVIDKNNEVIDLSGGDRKLTILIVEEETEIHVRLAEDNGMNYVTHWTFIIEPFNDYQISFYDVLEDENVDFGYWCHEKK
jgi:hypothetical protein